MLCHKKRTKIIKKHLSKIEGIDAYEYMCELIKNGIYSIHKNGEIRRIIKYKNGKNRIRCNRLQNYIAERYMGITLREGKKFYRIRIHKMIWIYYKGKVPEGKELNHKDGNKSNNSLNNLELVTHKENMVHAVKIIKTIKTGWEAATSKHSKVEYISILAMINGGKRNCEIMRAMNMPKSTVRKIRLRYREGKLNV